MKKLLFMSCLSYLLTGCTHVIFGAVLPELLAHYGRSYSDGGFLVFLQFGGFLLGVLSMPAMARRISRRTTITTAFGLLFLAMVSIVLLPPWPLAVSLTFIAGVAFGLVEASISTFVLMAAKDNQATAFSKLEVAFGLGALIMPLISSILIANDLWKYGFMLLGISALATGIIWSKLSLGEHDELLAHKADRTKSANKPPALMKSSLTFLILFMFVFFLYVGMENTIVNFLPSIFIDQLHASSSVASLAVTAYWLAMVFGRVFAGIIAEKLTYFRYLLFSFAASVVTLLLWMFSSELWSSFAIVLLLGLFMSGMYAVALIYANQLLPGRTEQITSTLIAAGGLGGSILPLGVGWGMDKFQTGVSIWFVLISMCLVLGIVIYTKKWRIQAVESN
ncbi:putative glucose/mannose:H+ symporter GlcP [Paenibacillus marchantiophytorum]|uniref:Glucose/mannose:H+ symporter GlcP n=1 Tax=Paenibacillus marchantiophytorum TaxID=1619310 RepID=A0ABQ1FEU0_9BACL|nr:MFS transporter [Paenibacillus marchantiophytorum]GGA09059.1 putative glucose/mannose:H+ symporter GlcP [Paenibacillus marchantiophytorum]